MSSIFVRGGVELRGRVEVSGAKNAVLPILAAALMAPSGVTRLESVPRLVDVLTMVEVLEQLGVRAAWREDVLLLDAENLTASEASFHLVSKMRASVLIMGPLLGRLGKARVSLPGGCAIGARPLDLHLKGFSLLGAEIVLGHGYIEATASQLIGNTIYLDFPSVGATENIMMAACFAQGLTTIQNAAEEPEIVDLACFINGMGGRVEGAGTDTIVVHGRRPLHAQSYRVIPDRIEAGTYMVAAAITGGDLIIENVIPEHVISLTAKLREAGVTVHSLNDGMHVVSSGVIEPVDIKTLPYPGFPTDMQPQMMALLALACGTSMITETVFENRFMHVPELRRMGANIRTDGRSAVVSGVRALSGAPVTASDLRAGAALILAGLVAEGVTEVCGVGHIERGYVGIVPKLKSLGADIWQE
ncbi:MAG: UDP-N-acetylglucosamine 1-carboxyvinyltransferase 1 [Firmicutes bacterium]|nr:UDP-N-acetylglucosamine 1-carboxyvinyltransferase 1 [candidate division NPL-UPA2 bacterium]